MVSFNDALEGIKSDLRSAVSDEWIQQICEELNVKGRRRVLTPVVTTFLALNRAMHGASLSELRRVSGFDVTPQACCQAMARLPVELFARLQRAIADDCQAVGCGRRRGCWNGRRLFLIDGTGFSMPDTPELQKTFGQPGGQQPGCGFPVAHLLISFDAQTGVAVQTVAAPLRTHDLTHAAATHETLEPGDILVGDRAFGSFAHLALLHQRGRHGVFRAHQRRPEPGRRERWVIYPKPKLCPSWMNHTDFAALPDALRVREVPVRITTPGGRIRRLVLVTTLLDAVRFPASMIADMFAVRWRAETNIGYLKQTLGLDVLRSRSVAGVLKELHCIVIIYNMVRRVMAAAARQQRVDSHRISFIDAWRWLRHAQPQDRLPELIVNPLRPNRIQPRVRKRRPKQYPVMQQPRPVLQLKLLRQANHALT